MFSLPETVTIAPLVLLSMADHYNRISKDTGKSVLGVLLGSRRGNTVRIANSFAVPFEEDAKDSEIWFLDHNFIENMQNMFKKVNANERLIGWYHSGPRLRAGDLQINELFKRYTPNPLLLVADVAPESSSNGMPVDVYYAIDEIKADGSSAGRTFVHVSSEIKAEDAEEIGVEHLLRDVRNTAAGSLVTRITDQLNLLKNLDKRLCDIARYLDQVLAGELPVNHDILGELQNVFNLLPNLSAVQSSTLAKSFSRKTNDQLMIVYLSSLVRAIIAFHNMIDNKIENKKAMLAVQSKAEHS